MINRLEKFNRNPTRSEATELIESLETFIESLTEVEECIEELTGFLDTWSDEDVKGEEHKDAAEYMDSAAYTLIESLKGLRSKLEGGEMIR